MTTTPIAPAVIARADRFVTVLARHDWIVTTDVAALALHRVDMFDRIGATEPGSLRRQQKRVAAAARSLLVDFDELPATSPTRGAIRMVVAEALAAAGPEPA